MDKQNIKINWKSLCNITFILSVCFILTEIPAKAQFYITGDDPGNARWSYVESPSYRVIYPKGMDSTAVIYANTLEKFRLATGRSCGYIPGERIKRRMPVVLHPYTSWSNGSVAWAPKRADLFTTPQAHNSDALPWTDMLTVHESRHIAQMQFGLTKAIEPFGWFFGEMFNGLAAGLYPGSDYLEGDAVIAETALGPTGRGRDGEFLNYYMIAADQGDFRIWSRWLYGSQKYYAPDYYSLGYFFLSGIRAKYDQPEYMANYLDFAARRPWNLNHKSAYTRELTKKNFKKTFNEIMYWYNDIWQKELKERGPYMTADTVYKQSKAYTEYRSLIQAGKRTFAIKMSFNRPDHLVELLPNGKEKFICDFSFTKSKLTWSPIGNRIYWSEIIPDKRWSLAGSSAIRYIDLGDMPKDDHFESIGHKRQHTLAKGSKYYHPYPDQETGTVWVAEYLLDGRTQIVALSPEDGRPVKVIAIPDDMQVLEPLVLDGKILFSAITPSGTGIFSIDATSDAAKPAIATIVHPVTVSLHNLQAHNDGFTFTSDRNGVSELYYADLNSQNNGEADIYQVTNTRYGSNWHIFRNDELLYAANLYNGKLLNRLDKDELMLKKVSLDDKHEYVVAEELVEQEKVLAQAFPSEQDLLDWKAYKKAKLKESKQAKKAHMKLKKKDRPKYDLEDSIVINGVHFNLKVKNTAVMTSITKVDSVTTDSSNSGLAIGSVSKCQVSEPKPYKKFPHLFNIHSWAPVYIGVDNIMNFSFDHLYEALSLGATGLLQNQLGTFVAQIGYAAHLNPYRKTFTDQQRWQHSGHLKITYTGLYPVLEAQIDFNDRNRLRIVRENNWMGDNLLSLGTVANPSNTPFVQVKLGTYIPFRWQSGGWQQGLVPQLQYTFNNDLYDLGLYNNEWTPTLDGFVAQRGLRDYKPGKKVFTHNLSFKLRGYHMMSQSHTGVFPRMGIGAEAGVSASLTTWDLFSPNAFTYVYGYLPGIWGGQGLKLSAISQYKINPKASFNHSNVNVLPRGLADKAFILDRIGFDNNISGRLTCDYAIPIFAGDINIDGNFIYIKRFVLTPHFDWTWTQHTGNFFSVGASFQIDLAAIIWLGVPLSVGVTYSYNGGSGFKHMGPDLDKCHHFVGPVFNITLP